MDLSDEQYLFDDNLIWSGCQVLSRVHLTTKNLDNRHVAVCTSDREGERRASLSAYTTYDGHLKCTGALNVLNRCNPCLYDTVSMLGHFYATCSSTYAQFSGMIDRVNHYQFLTLQFLSVLPYITCTFVLNEF